MPRGESGSRFHRALDDLQQRLLVAKVGEEEEWRNGFIWDAFHRWMPDVVKSAGRLTAEEAAACVLTRYIRIVGAASVADIEATFGWGPRLVPAATARAALGRVSVDGDDLWTLPRLWSSRRRL